MIIFMVVVLPVPGPPVSMNNPFLMHSRTALICRGSVCIPFASAILQISLSIFSSMPGRSFIIGIFFSASILAQDSSA